MAKENITAYRLTAEDATAKAWASAQRTASDGIGRITSLIPGLAAALSAAGLVDFAKQGIDAADRLNDLSKSTGIAVETLSGYQLLARQTGTDLEGLAKAVNKMSVEMGKYPEKFRALGITATDNTERFKQFADLFSTLPDINQRNALANAVFGRSWAELAPALSEGGKRIGEIIEKGTRLSGMTTEMAEKADEFNDRMAELNTTLDAVKTRIAVGLLPILATIVDEMLKVENKSADLTIGFSPLTEAVRTLTILGSDFAFVWQQIGIAMVGVNEQFKGFKSGGIEGFSSAREMIKKILAENRSALDEFQKKVMDAGKFPLTRGTVLSGTPFPKAKVDDFLGIGDAERAKAKAAALKNAVDMGADLRKLYEADVENRLELERGGYEAMRALREADIESRRAAGLANAVEMGEGMRDLFEQQGAADIANRDQLYDSLFTEEEALRSHYEQEFDMLNDLNYRKVIANEEYYALMGRLVLSNEQKQLEIKARAGNASAKAQIELQQFELLSKREQTGVMMGMLTDMTAGVAQNNRAMFEINKVASIASVGLNSIDSISKAYNFGSTWGGPAGGAAMAAIAFVATAAHIAAIASTEFGGGGSAPSIAGSTPAPPVSVVNSGAPSNDGGSQTTIVNWTGGSKSDRKLVREFAEMLNENRRDGGRIVVT